MSAFDTYSGKLDQLEALGLEQSSATLGISDAKDTQLISSIEKAFIIVSAVGAYATSVGNDELIAKTDISISDLRFGSRVNCLLRIDRILVQANAHIAELEPFGISPADVAELETLRVALNTSFIAPRQAILNRKQITAAIHTLIREIDDVLKSSLDKLMIVVQPSDQVFFNKYTIARTILDYGTTHKAVPNSVVAPEPDDGGGGGDPGE